MREEDFAYQQVLEDAAAEIQKQLSENELLRSKVKVMEWQAGEALQAASRVGELEGQLLECQRTLAGAHVKEAQLMGEKRTLERRYAELRMAYEVQQQSLVDATSQANAYRRELVHENCRLSKEVEHLQHDKSVYVGSLLPLLADFGLHPDANDARSVVQSADDAHVVSPAIGPFLYDTPQGSSPDDTLASPWNGGTAPSSQQHDESRGGKKGRGGAGGSGRHHHRNAEEHHQDGDREEHEGSAQNALGSTAAREMGPSIEGLRILGDAYLGGKLTACGHSVNGTELCVFQWTRHYDDGTAEFISDHKLEAQLCAWLDEGRAAFSLLDVQDRKVGSPSVINSPQRAPCNFYLKRAEYVIKRKNRPLFREAFGIGMKVTIPHDFTNALLITGEDRELVLEFQDSRHKWVAKIAHGLG
eukprot:jgi/Mesen1/7660/ME000400S06853